MNGRLMRKALPNFVLLLTIATGCRQPEKRVALTIVDDAKENYLIPNINTKIIPIDLLPAFSSGEIDGQIRIDKFAAGVKRLFNASSYLVGDILVLPVSTLAPQGALRKIQSVENFDSYILLKTEPARINDAIMEGYVHQSIRLNSADSQTESDVPEGVEVQPTPQRWSELGKIAGLSVHLKDFVLSDHDGNRSTRSDQLRLNADFQSEMNGQFTLRVKGGQVEELSFQLAGGEFSEFSLTGSIPIPIVKNIPIIRARYKPIVITISGFPVVLNPSSDLELNSRLSLTGDMFFSASRESNYRTGLSYVGGTVTPMNEYFHNGTSLPPYVQVPQAKADIGFRLKSQMSLYDTLSAYAGVRVLSSYDTSLSNFECYRALAGANAFVGLYLGAFGIQLGRQEKKWDLASAILGEGPCLPSENSGRDPRTFAWRYSDQSSEEMRTPPNVDRSAQGGLLLTSSQRQQSSLLRFSRDGSVPVARQDNSDGAVGQIVKGLRDGDFVLVGRVPSGFSVERSDPMGRVIWSYVFNHSDSIEVTAIEEEPVEGSLYLAGSIQAINQNQKRAFLTKLSPTGESLWTREYRGPLAQDSIFALRGLPSGNLVVGGSISIDPATPGIHPAEASAGKTQFGWLGILDPQGQLILSKILASQAVIAISEPLKKQHGELAVIGYSEEIGRQGPVHFPWVMRVNQSGSVTMMSKLEDPVHPVSIAPTFDGFIIAGTWNNQSVKRKEFNDGWLGSISLTGEVNWARKYFTTQPDGLSQAFQQPDGRLLIAGYEESLAHQMKPVVFNLPLNGEALFLKQSGYSLSEGLKTTGVLPLSDLPQAVSSAPVNNITREKRGVGTQPIEALQIERIGGKD